MRRISTRVRAKIGMKRASPRVSALSQMSPRITEHARQLLYERRDRRRSKAADRGKFVRLYLQNYNGRSFKRAAWDTPPPVSQVRR
jgi:hypothetical protein